MGSCTSATEVCCLKPGSKYKHPDARQMRNMIRKPNQSDLDTSVEDSSNEFRNEQDLKDNCIGVYFQKEELINKLKPADAHQQSKPQRLDKWKDMVQYGLDPD